MRFIASRSKPFQPYYESGFPHEGRLDFIDNRVDPASGTVRMRAVLENKDGALIPGLFARVQVGADMQRHGAAAGAREPP